MKNEVFSIISKMETSLKIHYSRTAMRFGWERALLDNGKVGYQNVKLMKYSEHVPHYQAEEQVLLC
jgi:hypothetical protein